TPRKPPLVVGDFSMDQLLQIEFDEPRDIVLGIDLGTTNSLVAYYDLTGPEIITSGDGHRIVPSVVAWREGRGFLVGDEAREVLIETPDQAVYSVKRLMGRDASDISDELKLFPFHLASEQDSVLRLQLG